MTNLSLRSRSQPSHCQCSPRMKSFRLKTLVQEVATPARITTLWTLEVTQHNKRHSNRNRNHSLSNRMTTTKFLTSSMMVAMNPSQLLKLKITIKVEATWMTYLVWETCSLFSNPNRHNNNHSKAAVWIYLVVWVGTIMSKDSHSSNSSKQ